MSRPYLSLTIEDLERLFNDQGSDPCVLQQLIEELAHRQTKRAHLLLSHVANKLASFEVDNKEGSVDSKSGSSDCSTKGNRSVGSTHADVPGESGKDVLWTNKRTGIPNGGHHKFDPSGAAPSQGQGGARSHQGAGHTSNVVAATAQDFEQPPDDRKRPGQLSRMRPPGAAGLPNPWTRPLDQDVTLDVSKDADLPEVYIAALTALIAEIKRTGAGQKRYEVESGARVDAPSGETVYAFPFTDEADLFEDAKVEVQVPGRRVEGSIVSISAGRLVLALKEDLGPVLDRAIILVDASALLEVLRERFEQIKKGEIAINRRLADAVVTRGIRPPADPTPIPTIRLAEPLNEAQSKAYKKALTAAITYIWGPPGCGKTWILARVVRAAFEAERRVLICSNTNKAVDQVLYKLCQSLTIAHKAMEEGRIVRVGRIADDRLKEYHAYVNVDGIVERRSAKLAGRRKEIEEEISRIDARTARARELIELFERLELAMRTVEVLKDETNAFARTGNKLKADLEFEKARTETLEKELQERVNTRFGFFKRSEEAIRNDMSNNQSLREKIFHEIETVKGRYAEARGKLEAAQQQRDWLKGHVAGHDRQVAERQVAESVERRDALVAELREIEAKIAQLRTEILKEARIIGATCTKAYMSVRELGQVDMVIIDEASMVTLPMVWIAAGLARERVVICGDFRQISPIVQTNQQAIFDVLGPDVFTSIGLADPRVNDERMVMLEKQHRMDAAICELVSKPMYGGRLTTASNRVGGVERRPPAPFDGTLTVVDTADLWPFESVNAFFSRFNLMQALLVRNLAWYFSKHGYIRAPDDLGICTPYAAQSKLIRKLLDGEGLRDLVQVGTVHSFQGDQRNTIVLEIPEGHGGGRMLGQFVQGVPPQQVGARLINVAVSRAQNHLIILANLTHLDRLLPGSALLREILYNMQNRGRVVTGRELLALRPIERDLRGLIGCIQLDLDAESLGLFNQSTFEPAVTADIANAKESIVIFSGFVTPRRVAKLGDLFRAKIAEGVRVRCVTRPPQLNGTMTPALGKEALDALQGIGCVVDCRARIHEKVVLIDKAVVWHGSLNVLSHTHRTDESMTRLVNAGLAQAVAANMSKRRMSGEKALAAVAEPENPRCQDCGSRTVYEEGKFGPFFYCEDECGWSMNLKTMERKGHQKPSAPSEVNVSKDGPLCPICKSKTKLREGRFGPFYGCIKYPACKGTVKAESTAKKTKGRKGRKPTRPL